MPSPSPARPPRLSDLLVPASALALTLLSGCWARHLPGFDFDAGSPSSGTGGSNGLDASRGTGGSPASCGAGGATIGARKLDILFMIDNSSSMAPLQAKLRAQVPTFIDTLVDPATGTLPDLHVAVVSSSFGGGAWSNVNQCHSAAADPTTMGDDQGRFRQGRSVGSCPMLHPGAKFLDSNGGGGTPNFDGDLRDAVGCIANLGDTGCGFESQFESIYYALHKGSLSPAEDPDNGGFLRCDAKLAIVLLTNEDDCSVRSDSLLLDPAVNSVSDPSGLGALASYRCNEFGHLCNGAPPPHGNLPAGGVTLNNCVSAEDAGKTDDLIKDPNGNPDPTRGHLWPTVAELEDHVRTFKANPNDIFVAAIAGPTTGPMGESLYHVSPQANPAAGGELDPVVDHSCVQSSDTNGPEYADPAVRIKQWVDGFGANGAFYPICGPDLSAAMTGIAQGIHAKLTP